MAARAAVSSALIGRRRARHGQFAACAVCLLGAVLSRSSLLGAPVIDASWLAFLSWPGVPRTRLGQLCRRKSDARPAELQQTQALARLRLAGARRAVALSAKKGFGAEPAAPGGEEVAEPAGGWPTVSVLVLSAGSKLSQPEALKQLAEQDYPLDRIQEVVVADAASLSSSAPEALGKLLRDFQHPDEMTLNLGKEIAGCSGDMVAIWGDAQVSASHRLRAQVAGAVDGQTATLLQPTWFFDPLSQGFHRIREWPVQMIKDIADLGLSESLIKADLLTLCGQRAALADASADVQPDASPEQELKELVQKLPQPQLIEELRWAAVRSPPSMARYEPATPDGSLVQLAQAAFPKGSASTSTSQLSLDAVVKGIDDSKLNPAEAVDALLSDEELQMASEASLRKVGKAMAQSLKRAGPESLAAAVEALTSWRGLIIGQGDVKAARKFPIFYEAFVAVRVYTNENADFLGVEDLGRVSEGLVILAQKMWAADSRVSEVMSMILSKELYQQGGDVSPAKQFSTADVVGTLGLRDPLQACAYAALDIPNSLLTVDALSSLAWALSEGGVENSSLQIKVAKGVIANIDKVMPPDIGKIFVAMHEREWFKDKDSIAYLTQSIMSRIQDLKAQDPGIAKMLAEAQASAR